MAVRFPGDAEAIDDMLMSQADYERRHVDRLPGRKKGTADALAAVCYHLSYGVPAWTAGWLAGRQA